ncbi:MAG: SDR family NAD(P)-dependent oxidoreductase [Deltaproteobacteria bacterium]|nr:SDR family NAD(P)-dependent oxidoreductase [Deltaproteobacteria bacterium]
MSAFRDRYGPWALIAGAAEGLGAAFAHEAARRGLDLLLADLQTDKLAAVARSVETACGVRTRCATVDLGAVDTWERLQPLLHDAAPGLLIYNAGRSYVGPFLSQPWEDQRLQLEVNCRGPLRLVHKLAPELVARGRGGIVLLSSMTGLTGHALVACYGATKAFNLVLAEALWAELHDRGVDVLAVCPGPTRTPGYEASKSRLPPGFVMEPAHVAREALDALGRGPVLVPGAANRATAAVLSRALPRGAATKAMSRLMRAIYRR